MHHVVSLGQVWQMTYHTDSPSRVLAAHLVSGQRSQDHKVQKHIEGDQVAGVSLHFVESPTSTFNEFQQQL